MNRLEIAQAARRAVNDILDTHRISHLLLKQDELVIAYCRKNKITNRDLISKITSELKPRVKYRTPHLNGKSPGAILARGGAR